MVKWAKTWMVIEAHGHEPFEREARYHCFLGHYRPNTQPLNKTPKIIAVRAQLSKISSNASRMMFLHANVSRPRYMQPSSKQQEAKQS